MIVFLEAIAVVLFIFGAMIVLVMGIEFLKRRIAQIDRDSTFKKPKKHKEG
jgi:hypothetical protein